MASLSMSTSLNNTRPLEQDDQGRLRVSKACTRCRTRKDRCDGLKPSCSACANANKQCIYEPTTKKRGLPEGYVRGLEKLLTLASHSIGGLEDVLVGYLRNDEVKKSWNAPVGDELYTTWKESKLYQELEVFLGNSSGMKRKRTSDDEDGSESPGDRLDTILQLLRGQGHSLSVTHNADDPETDGLQSAPAHRAGGQDYKALPTNSKELLDSYFTYVHCWFPVLDRPSVLKAYYSHLKKPPISHSGKRLDGDQALLWAIFAYATVIDSPEPDRKELSRRYSEISINYIPAPSTNDEDVQDFDATHGQALLVLALLRLGNGQWLGCWNCTGRAVRILLALRNERHEDTQPNCFRGALQGAFMIETLLNVHFRNPRSLFPISLIDIMIDEDGYEEWGTWSPPHGSMSTSNEPSYTLSLFNRLTRVFLILHEALTNVDANADSQFIHSKLESIHNLAQEHFRAGIGSPSLHSPPHHVYFQIGLLFAQLRLVSCVSETARHQFDLTSLAINVLGLFEICSKADHIGLSRVPPLYADILVLASDVAAQARHTFGGSPSSPSYSNFTSTITDFRSRLSNIWDSFRRPEPQTIDVEYDLDLTSMPEVPLSASTLTNSSIPDPWPTQQKFPPHSTTYAQIGRSSFSRNSFGQSSRTFGMAYPVTSPSFSQGDEVDAIFHEMAHLDTNEWTNERVLGLKDFGFTDESAFMDFCNDPERLGLAVESASAAPLSSSKQSWTFAAHPS